jgi:hypothetical protein
VDCVGRGDSGEGGALKVSSHSPATIFFGFFFTLAPLYEGLGTCIMQST